MALETVGKPRISPRQTPQGFIGPWFVCFGYKRLDGEDRYACGYGTSELAAWKDFCAHNPFAFNFDEFDDLPF